MEAEANRWDDSICWFCKQAAASEEAKHEVNLYRVLERKSTYVVVGIRHQQRYEKAKTWVPRCERCKVAHDRVGMVFGAFWLVFGTATTVWYVRQPGIRSESFLVNVLGGAIGIVMVYVMCAVPVGLLYMFINKLWNSEDEAEGHPRVESLKNEGWQVGDKPPYKQ